MVVSAFGSCGRVLTNYYRILFVEPLCVVWFGGKNKAMKW